MKSYGKVIGATIGAISGGLALILNSDYWNDKSYLSYYGLPLISTSFGAMLGWVLGSAFDGILNMICVNHPENRTSSLPTYEQAIEQAIAHEQVTEETPLLQTRVISINDSINDSINNDEIMFVNDNDEQSNPYSKCCISL